MSLANINARPIRPQQYRLKWPLTPEQVENIDTMLETLFKATRTLQTGVAGVATEAEAVTTIPTASLLATVDDSGSEPALWPGAIGATGATGATGPAGSPALYPPEASDEPVFLPPPTATALPSSEVTTLTGTQNDLAIPAGCTFLRCNNASLLTITGIAAGVDGQILDIVSIGAGVVSFTHQAAGSSAVNRLINIATSAAMSLAAGVGTVRFRYDGNTQRWRMVYHEQGDWLSTTFAAGDFTASGGGTWTVASGDRVAMLYYLRGRQLTVAFQVDATTVSGGPLFLQIGNGQWGGFTAMTTGIYGSMGFAFDNLVSSPAYVRVTAATTIDCGLSSIAAWANSTDQTYVRANIAFQVT